MTLHPQNLIPMLVMSLRDPRGFMLGLSTSDMPRQARWELLVLMVILGTVLTQLNVFLAVMGSDAARDPMQAIVEKLILERPLIHALMQFSVLTIAIFLIHWVGQAAGGQGSFEAAILAVAWIELLMSALRIAQAVIWLASPGLAALVGVLMMVAFLWLLTQFVTELHGFASPLWVLLGILGVALGVLFGLSMILGLLGLSAGVM
jgi:hypothetical protein